MRRTPFFLLATHLILSTFIGGCQNYAKPLALEVPYIQGDTSGMLTEAVIEELSANSHRFIYNSSGAPYQLHVELSEKSHRESLGYHLEDYTDLETGKEKKSMIPTEERLRKELLVSVIEVESGKVLAGPDLLPMTIEYGLEGSFDIPVLTLEQSAAQLLSPNDVDDASKGLMERQIAQSVVEWLDQVSGSLPTKTP